MQLSHLLSTIVFSLLLFAGPAQAGGYGSAQATCDMPQHVGSNGYERHRSPAPNWGQRGYDGRHGDSSHQCNSSCSHGRSNHQPTQTYCAPGEIRVSPNGSTWFDLYIDGVKRVESRVRGGQRTVSGLQAGSYHVRVTNFMGRVWSEQRVEIGCGGVVIADVYEDHGLYIVNQWADAVSAGRGHDRGRYSDHNRRDRGYGHDSGHQHSSSCGHPGYGNNPGYGPNWGQGYGVCTTGSTLRVSAPGNAWFDLYIDGAKRVSSRVNDGQQRVNGLTPGQHHVRVTDFMGRVWSEGYLNLGCGDSVSAEVYENSGLRVLNRPELYGTR